MVNDPRMLAQALQAQQGAPSGPPQAPIGQAPSMGGMGGMGGGMGQQAAPPSALAAALRGGAAYNDKTHGGLNRMMGMQQQRPQSAGGMVGAMGAAAGGPSPAAALPVLANAGNIGQGVSNATGNPMGLGDQARAAGNFVQGNFGGAWDGLKDSVKNLFRI